MYCIGINTRDYQLSDKDKLSGTRSLQLGFVLSSHLRVSARASRYVFQSLGQKTRDARHEKDRVHVDWDPLANPWSQKSIPPTGGDWRLFECALENKDIAPGTVLEALLHNAAGRIDPHYSIYVDDVFFGDPADYVYDPNGCLIRGGQLLPIAV